MLLNLVQYKKYLCENVTEKRRFACSSVRMNAAFICRSAGQKIEVDAVFWGQEKVEQVA